MAIYVIELEGNDAADALAAGKQFLAGEKLLGVLAELCGSTPEQLQELPSDLSIEYGQYTTAQIAAINAQIDAAMAGMKGDLEGFELDETAPAWVILTSQCLPFDNMTYRLRRDGTFEPVALGVEV